MNNIKSFSCYIMGDDNITLECANIILTSSHKLLGLISSSEKIKKWCTTNSIANLENIKQFEKEDKHEPFDFLFSIANSKILPKDFLKLPRYYAINYHNSALPKYAGLYATSWAILNGEKQHAISWHIMDEIVDAGSILKQPSFSIEDSDTALSLNLKCYEQAIHSFKELIDELATDSISYIKQDLSYRSYYGLKNKPANWGFISWSKPAEDIDKLIRALTFGNYLNQLVTPKVVIKGNVFVVKSHKKLDNVSGLEPGRIVNISNKAIQVATETSDIALLELIDLNGKNYSIEKLVKLFTLHINLCLDKIADNFIVRLTNSTIQDPKVEKFWVDEFLKNEQEEISFLSHLLKRKETPNLTFPDINITKIPNKLLEQLKKRSAEPQSLKNILLTAALIYLYRLNNYKNLSIEFSNKELRTYVSGLESFLANSFPFSTKFDSHMTFTAALEFITSESIRLLENKTYAKDIFIRYPELKNASSTIEINISFVDSKKPLYKGNKKLTICISEDCKWFYFHNQVNYQSHPESYAFFEKMNKHFLTLLNDIANYPEKELSTLSIINKKEKKDLLETWNNTSYKYDYKKPLHHYLEEQVTKTPDSIAIVFKNNSMTYEKLNQEANKLAYYLRCQGVKADDLVGISLERGFDMLIGILGILKSGGAYLPLDPNYPKERISYMLHNSQSNWLLMNEESIKSKPHGYNGKTIKINSVLNLKNLPDENLNIISKSSNLAYVIYTSGSTGRPKGVAISHRSICNHMIWMQKEYDFQSTDVFLQKTPFSFDASVWEFFMPLLVGGTLVMAPSDAHASASQIIRLVKEKQVSALQLVPSMLKELVSSEDFGSCSSLRHVFCGGEILLPETINAFFRNHLNANLHNLYGPTETTIESITLTCTEKDATTDASRIGKPIHNTKVYVLDDKMQLVPVGITGEIYIAGDGLARGYLHNPEFTKQKFIFNPFSHKKSDRLYKTGDLGKWQSDGYLEYIGRQDNQVKIRGFRIEVNEIESHLEKITSIHQAVVIPESKSNGMLSLSAYLVLEKDSQITTKDIRSILKKEIPEYMVPSRFLVVDKLPLTPSGKIDRKAFPILSRQLDSGNDYVVPHNDIEKALKNIWCSVLNEEEIGIYDDFFELGGNSLTAMNIIALIQEKFLVNLKIRKLFECPTIYALAKEIEKQPTQLAERLSNRLYEGLIVPLQIRGSKTPLFLVHPIGGSVFWYKALAKYFDKDRPLYAIHDPGLDKNELIFDTLEEMASTYIDAIKAIQPHEPYLLGGASFGSTVAIEMAKQLEDKKENVSSIVLLDGWASYPIFQNNELYFQKVMEEQNTRILKRYLENNIHNSKFLLNLQWHREKMLMQYKLPLVKCKLILFKAKILSEMFQYDAPLNWWENYSAQSIELHLVPGDHESMFYEPNVQVLAKQLSNSLNEIEIEHAMM